MTINVSLRPLIQVSLATLFSLQTLVLALTLAWLVLAKFDFLYAVFHDHAGIGEGIDLYGPQNTYKVGFGETTRNERVRLFSEINHAVHHNGVGLGDIRYSSPLLVNRPVLLREAEVIHLHDVAKLIHTLVLFGIVNVFSWLLIFFTALVRGYVITWRSQAFGLIYTLLSLVAVLVVFGPVNVFNQLHIWVFPSGHQWFFYYQESLMSTLMMAPSLFGWIALALVLLTIPLFLLLSLMFHVAKKKYSERSGWS